MTQFLFVSLWQCKLPSAASKSMNPDILILFKNH